MPVVTSTMLPLGTAAPSFSLPDAISGRRFSNADFTAQALLVMFVCNHCPFVVHLRDELTRLAAGYVARGVAVVAINANSLAAHPEDGPAQMKALGEELAWPFPFLFDESQATARDFRAACTPDFFLFDRDHRLAYRGQFDESRPKNGKPVTGADLRAALEEVLAGRAPDAEQRPSIGCAISWNA